MQTTNWKKCVLYIFSAEISLLNGSLKASVDLAQNDSGANAALYKYVSEEFMRRSESLLNRSQWEGKYHTGGELQQK